MTKQFKDLIGQYIYLIPTGNSVSRSTPLEDQIIKTTLIKVGRTNLTTISGSYNWEGKLDKHNFGYIHFTSEQEAKEYFLKRSLEREFKELFSFGSTKFSYTELNNAMKVLKKEIKINDNS